MNKQDSLWTDWLNFIARLTFRVSSTSAEFILHVSLLIFRSCCINYGSFCMTTIDAAQNCPINGFCEQATFVLSHCIWQLEHLIHFIIKLDKIYTNTNMYIRKLGILYSIVHEIRLLLKCLHVSCTFKRHSKYLFMYHL